jgi:CRISPR-associated protein (TIGR02710 family)
MPARIRGLVLTVGGTPQPLLHSIGRAQPSRIALVHSQGTAGQADQVESVARPNLPDATQWRRYAIDHPDELQDCFCRVQEAVRDLRAAGLRPGEIAIDFTGGTKAMSAAAVLAAAQEGCRFIYVSGERRTKEGVGTVENGAETLVHPGNPWEVMEEPTIRRALGFADQFLWPAAIGEVEVILGRCRDRDKGMFGLLKDILGGLARWDAFDHVAAWKMLGGEVGDGEGAKPCSGAARKPAELKHLARATEHVLLQRFAVEVSRRLGALTRVCKALDRQPDRPPDPLIIDLVANADRRARQGLLDEAILRLYRALELQADRTMRRRFGYGADAVPVGDLPPALANGSGVYLCKGGCTCRLGLDAAYRFLEEKGDALGTAYRALGESLDIQSRNRSWLIHGQGHATRRQFESFRSSVVGLFDLSAALPCVQWSPILSTGAAADRG